MTDKAVNAFTQSNNFSLNGNAGLTIVTFSAGAQGSVGKGDIVLRSGRSGAFAGLDISGSDIVADTGYDQCYYGRNVGAKAIISGQAGDAHPNNKLKSELSS